MQDLKLSEHFTLWELAATRVNGTLTANRRWAWDGRASLGKLCATLLEPIRKKFGQPVYVTSGARCPKLNSAIGGDERSQHVLCQAADFVVKGFDDLEGSLAVFEWIYKESELKFGQLIHEFKSGRKKDRPDKIWLHISLGEPYRYHGECQEVLTFKDGQYRMVRKGAG